MIVEYERNLRHNYMVIREPDNFRESYQTRIIEKQKIKGILPLEVHMIDGKAELYYDISAKQKLSEWLKIKKINYEILKGIVNSLREALEVSEDYLLDANCFLIEPEYMYIDIASYQIYLCFCPEYAGDIAGMGQAFLQYILDRLDYNDKRAVEAAYELFRLSMLDTFSIELLKKGPIYEESVSGRAVFVENNMCLTDIRENREVIDEQGIGCETGTHVGDKEIKKEWKSIVPVTVMPEEAEDEEEQFYFVPLNMGIRVSIAAGLICLEVLVLVLVIFLFPYSLSAWIILGVITILAVGVMLCITVFYNRLMQMSRIVSIKRNIEYNDACDDVREADKREDNIISTDSAKDICNETILFGYMAEECDKSRRLQYIGAGTQEDIVITKTPFIVGKSRENVDYFLDYPFVSRLHFKLEEVMGEYFITDTNSKNGLSLNGTPVKANETVKISEGDTIELGNLLFIFC
ncbi:MAG: FHA domain-containing protein [Lachnospiraceae bacterium]|nr:FHA domain-containing protein [Lachnospiraceae bacterium]